jgi:hypothetical protein
MDPMTRSMRPLPLVLAALAVAGCVIPLDGPKVGSPPVPTPAPAVPGTIVAGVPTGQGATGVGVLRAKQSSVQLGLGEERPLNALVVDANGLVQTSGVTWLSTNPSVVTVNPTSGQAKALGAGTAVVVATSQANPAATAQIEVTVTEAQLVKQIVVDPASPSIEKDGKVKLTATVHMADGTINANVKWQSSDESVATVSASGEVRGRKDGKVTIEAVYALDPRYKGIAVLTIGNPPPTAVDPGTLEPGVAVGGGEPGTVVVAQPTGKWVVQAIEGFSKVSGLWFRNATHGLLQADTGVFATEDGGSTWTSVGPATAFDPKGVAFLDADTAIGIGGQGVVRTTDGGATWTTSKIELPSPLPGYALGLLRVQAISATEAYALISDNNPQRYSSNVVFHTTDAGDTWEQETLAGFEKLQISAIAPAGDGKVALTSGGIFRYDPADGGWSKTGAAIEASYYIGTVAGDLAVVPGGKTIFAVGHNVVLRSDDAGKNWKNVGSPAGSGEAGSWTAPQILSFSDADHGLAVSTVTAFTTEDGGKTWAVATGVPSISMRAGKVWVGGARLSAGRAFVAGNDGQLFRFVTQ